MATDQEIFSHIEQPLADLGYEVISVQHQKDTRHGIKIILTIDRLDETAVNITDCTKVTKAVKVILEPLVPDYLLEVSSPGANRPLMTPKHFKRFIGSKIKVHLEPPSEEPIIKGVLSNADDDKIIVAGIEIPYTQIKRAHLVLG